MLYEKIREPITVFQSADEFDTPLRHKVRAYRRVRLQNARHASRYVHRPVSFSQVVDMYKSIVDRMKRYERSKIARWTNEAKLLAVRQMDSNVLVVAGAGEYVGSARTGRNIGEGFTFFFRNSP